MMSPGEVGLTGMAIGALAFVSRGLMDMLKARSESAQHSRILVVLDRIELRLKSLDAKHDDENSVFATVKLTEALQNMRIELAERGS